MALNNIDIWLSGPWCYHTASINLVDVGLSNSMLHDIPQQLPAVMLTTYVISHMWMSNTISSSMPMKAKLDYPANV